MRFPFLIGFTPLLACGCSNAIADANRQYDIVKNDGDAEAICRQGQVLADTYLKAGDEAGYRDRKLGLTVDCEGARSMQRDGCVERDGKLECAAPDKM